MFEKLSLAPLFQISAASNRLECRLLVIGRLGTAVAVQLSLWLRFGWPLLERAKSCRWSCGSVDTVMLQ